MLYPKLAWYAQFESSKWLVWKNSFLRIVEKHAPSRKARVRRRGSPWITSELKKQMYERDILKIQAIKYNDPVIWTQFKIQLIVVKKR